MAAFLSQPSQEPNKYFIITSGPTGSGKGTGLVKATLKQIFPDITNSQSEISQMEKFLIDDLVENSINYKEKVHKIIKDIKDDCCKEYKHEICDDENIQKCEEKEYFSDKIVNKFNEVYMDSRKNDPGCSQYGDSITKAEAEAKLNCDELLEGRLKEALVRKPNIIVFETTGQNDVKWLLDMIPPEYTVIFTYSLVHFDILLKRNQNRAYKDIQTFYENFFKHAPRLPEIRREAFQKIFDTIKNVALELYEKCVVGYDENEETCGEHRINRLLLFDNSKQGSKLPILVFDSNDNTFSDFTSALKNIKSGRMTSSRKPSIKTSRKASKKRTRKQRK